MDIGQIWLKCNSLNPKIFNIIQLIYVRIYLQIIINEGS